MTNRMKNKLGRCILEITDPRTAGRSFVLRKGVHWNSKQAGLVTFETASYGDFTDAAFLGDLVNTLVNVSKSKCIGFQLPNTRRLIVPEWISHPVLSRNYLKAVVRVEYSENIIKLFEQTADRGTWTFCGMLHLLDLTNMVMEFPTILEWADKLMFAFQLDLDGILLGWVRPVIGVDSVLDQLKAIGRGTERGHT